MGISSTTSRRGTYWYGTVGPASHGAPQNQISRPRIAQLEKLALAMLIASTRSSCVTGRISSREVDVPSPSCPCQFWPQQWTRPSRAVRAHAYPSPNRTSIVSRGIRVQAVGERTQEPPSWGTAANAPHRKVRPSGRTRSIPLSEPRRMGWRRHGRDGQRGSAITSSVPPSSRTESARGITASRSRRPSSAVVRSMITTSRPTPPSSVSVVAPVVRAQP